MTTPDLVVVGGSSGSLDALRALVSALPARFPAAILVATHLSPASESRLAEILSRHGPLPATPVHERLPLEPGRIYVATPNRHLVVEDDTVRAAMGPRENRARPSVDVLFRSAARVHGPRVIGVVLSGALDDGTAGLAAVKAAGGVTIVQDPVDAVQPSMPRSASREVPVDHCVRAEDLGALLVRLVTRREPPSMSNSVTPSRTEPPMAFACPECNGTLWQVNEGALARYACRVGHSFTEESLVTENGQNLERALWTALRILEERGTMLRQLASAARERGHDTVAAVWDEKVAETARDASVLRDVVDGDLARHTGA